MRVHRIVCTVDTGWVINPDTIKAQMEGGIVYGLTAALKGEITIKNGRVEQRHFGDYQVLRHNEMPEIELYITKAGDRERTAAGSLVNAVAAATGRRIYSLPIKAEQLRGGTRKLVGGWWIVVQDEEPPTTASQPRIVTPSSSTPCLNRSRIFGARAELFEDGRAAAGAQIADHVGQRGRHHRSFLGAWWLEALLERPSVVSNSRSCHRSMPLSMRRKSLSAAAYSGVGGRCQNETSWPNAFT